MKHLYKSLYIIILIGIFFNVQQSKAQLVAGEAFLQGNFLEVGVSTCGSYGTAGAAPCGYHSRNNFNTGIGFVADAARDGWTVGVPNYCGDYFLPGSPVEGWGIEVGGQSYINSNNGTICGTNNIAGSIASYSYASGQTTAIWNGSITAGAGTGLTFSQQTTLYDDGLYFITTVRICNTSGAAMSNLYYARNVDPDNDIMITGSYSTNDTIVSQPNPSSCEALVTTKGIGANCFMGIGTLASNARVSLGGFNTVAPISNYYNGIGYAIAAGATQSTDAAVQISYYWPTIAAGQCLEISFAHVMSRGDLAIAFTKLGNPNFFSGSRDISLTLRDTVCPSEPVTLSVVDDTSYRWTWAPTPAVSATSGTTTTVTTTTPITVTATAYRNGCVAFLRNIIVDIDTSVKININTRDTQICVPNLPVRLSPIISYDTIRPQTLRCDTYDVASIPFAPIALTGLATTVALADNELSTCNPIGFPFRFFCNDYKNFYISSNGFITFTPAIGDGCCAGQVLPNAANPNNLIALAWEDLNPSLGGTISYETQGVSPNKRLIVQFSNIMHTGGIDPVSGQIILYETSNRAEVHLTSMPGPGSISNPHTIGIENALGTRGHAPVGRNGVAGWTATNEAWRFSPMIIYGPALPLSYTWSPSTGLSSSTILNPIATTPVTRTYRLCVSNGYCTNICDTMTITVAPFNISQNINLCAGSSVRVGTHIYTTSGTYRDTLRSIHGCDSFVTTNLSITGAISSATRRDTICFGSSINIYGNLYTASGTYNDTLVNFRGCDSFVTIIISYRNNVNLVDTRDTGICLGNSIRLSVVATPAGTYTHNWGPSSTLSSTTVSNPLATPTTTTMYIDTIRDAWCTYYDSITISVGAAAPIVDATISPIDYCNGDTVTFNAYIPPPTTCTYTMTSIPYAPAITTGTGVSLSDDQVSGAIPMGFNFNFFCNNYSNIYISSNGFLTFNSASGSGCCSGALLPTADGLDNIIALFWDDLYPPGAGSITYNTLGTAPNRRFVVNYNGLPFCCGTTPAVTGQIILYETSNIIDLNITSAVGVSPGTAGIENSTGTVGYPVPGLNAATWPASVTNTSWRFSPVVSAVYTYSWSPTPGLFPRTDSAATRRVVTSTRSYYVTVSNAGCSTIDTVTVRPRLDVVVSPDSTICAGMPVRLLASITYDTIRTVGIARCDSYTVASIPYSPVATTGTGVSLSDDQVSGLIPMGFNFNFFCNNYSNIYISSNGFVTFNSASGSGCCGGGILPTSFDGVNDVIALFWDDLYPPGAGSITYNTLGVAPNRRFVVSYNGLPFCCGTTPAVTGQIILYETSNMIDVIITSAVGVSPGTAGIENSSGTIGYPIPGLNSSVWPASVINTSWRFSPVVSISSVTPVTYTWSPSTGLSSTSVLDPIANTSTNVNYIITTTAGRCIDVDTATLIIRARDSIYFTRSICTGQSFLFNGVNRTVAGIYRDTLINRVGCDSLVVLNLIVTSSTSGTLNQSICAGSSYLFNGVNRSTAGTYLDTLIGSGLCDSILTLNLIVIPTSTRTINATICSNQTYLFNGVNRNTTGVYLDTFANFRGCDSVVTLNLTVNPTTTGTINATICSNQTYLFNGVNRNTTGTYLDTFANFRGCDSVVTLNLTVNPTSTGTINATICSNQTYLFNGVNRNTTGTYLDTFINYRGCDSVVTLNLTVNPTSTGTINATICSNQTYLFNGVNRNTTGVYIDTFANFRGCDSVVTLNLTVNPTSTGTINATICSNQTYLFNGVNRNTTGTYLDTFVNFRGCDSVVTLNLTVNPTSTGIINATICSNQTYLFNGVNRNTTGTYLDTLVNFRGCDSVVTLNLTVNPTSTGTINTTICSNQTYLFNGVNRNTTGVYLDTFVNFRGCDSVVTLNLTVNPTSTGTINATICSNQTYLFNGVNRNTTGVYLDTFVNFRGCDSVVTLNLTVNPTTTGAINATICSNQTYLFNGVNRNTTGVYLDTFVNFRGCDSVVTLNLTVNPTTSETINATICSNQTYLFNGVNRNTTGVYLDTFVNFRGCDSVVTLNLTVNPTSTGTINATICSNQTYLFNGVNRNTTGTYLDTFVNFRGCDSVVTLNLTVNPTSTGIINATICSNQTYLFNGVNRNTTGTYLDTLVNFRGCDSVVTLNLTVNPTSTGTINTTICSNQTYLFNGVNRNTTGTYLDTFINYRGCDSVVTLNLTVNPTSTGTINATICSNQTYLFNGVNRNTTGVYLDTFVNYRSCDSVVTLNLTVNPTTTGTINATICSNQTYLFNGVNRNTTGTYLDTFANFRGCDSVVTLTLLVSPTNTGVLNQSICSGTSFLFNGVNLNVAGSYNDTLINIYGCDSILTLNLTIRPITTGAITQNICIGNTYLFNGVNLSTTGIYQDTFISIGGCDSILTLNLNIIPITTFTINATICSNQTYLFNGVNRNTTGTYLDTFVNFSGCDSVVTLNLTVNLTSTGTINATICSNQTYLFNGVNRNTTGTYLDTFINSSSCDSVVTLNLTVNPTSTGTINATICSNQTYLFNGVNRNTTGTYLDTFVNFRGCDSVVTLNLTVNPTTTGTINATICSNQTYLFNGVNRNTTGTYLDTFINSSSCDSVVTLNLVVNPTSTGTINATICSNQTYLFNGVNRNTTGTYLDTFINSSSCDSVVTLNLTVNPTSTGIINATICSNQTYLFNGVNRNTTGTYLDTFLNFRGCDSVVTLNLTVNPTTTGTINATICSNQTYLFNGVNRNTTGTYLDTFINSSSCDSVVTLNLVVNPTSTGTINATICSNQTYLFNGVNRNTTGSYIDTFINSSSCDSVVTLNLTVNPTSTGIINATICSNQTYLYNGVNRNTTGSYIDTFVTFRGCDSVVTLNLTVNPTSTGLINATICSNQTYLFNGVNRNTTGAYLDTFVNFRGCDSVVTLNLTVNPTSTGIINATICSNQTYLYNGVNRNTTGSYIDTFVTFRGCDSVVTLNLTVNPTSTGIINATICSNQTYLYNGVNRNTTGSYIDTFVNFRGCDSVVTLNLTVNPTSTGLINATICSNQTYLFNGVSRNTTGTYLDTFVNFRACDSVVTLNLTVNPTTTGTINATICSNQTYLFNGINRNITGVYLDTFINFRSCDSVVTLNLTVNLTSTGTINTTICSNQYYLFNGVNRNTTGTYLDTFVNFRGCDSVVTLNLTVNPTSTGTINATICSNQTYLFNGVNRNTSGTYLDTIINSRGCDSFLTLNLTVNPTSTGTINATICSNQTYLFNGVNRNTTGAYLDTFVNFRGCDSVVTLNLTVNPTTTGIINATICSNQTYLFNGINRNTTGVYIDTFVNFRGCDSVVTLNLTVLLTSTGIINQSICAGSSYFFNGVNRTLAGSYLDTLISINGCDSFLTLNLTIRNVTSGSINQVLCFGSNYLFNGVNRSVSGIYQDTLIGVNGCDSFLTLNLTIRGRISSTINQTICYGTSYLFNGVNLNIAGTYEDTLISNVGCDSFLTLNLSIGSFIFSNLQPIICEGDVFVVGTSVYSIDGSYRDTLISSTGCDSIVFTNLMVIPRVYQTQSFVLCLGQSITIGIHTYNTSGVYTDTFVSSVGCDSVLTTNLILQNPIIQRLDTTICSGSMYDGVVYTSNTVYNDTVLYSNIGCDSIILNIHIVVLPNIPIQVSTDTIICDGMNVLLDAYGGYTGIYTWTPSSYLSCGICPNPIANPPVGTFNYIVSSTDCEGNIISENVNVIVQSLPLINILNQDTCIYLGQVLDIVAQTDSIANTDVNWSIGNLNLCLDCSTYHFQPYITGSYIAMAYDTFGCTNADTFDICIINECGDTTIQLPNYITPNNDGFNDIFRMENPQNLPITFMRIFNRWGEMIYEAFGNNATWDATYINKPVNPGVYVYYIEGVCSSGGRFVKTGNLSVIK